jgi:hypothetical protein
MPHGRLLSCYFNSPNFGPRGPVVMDLAVDTGLRLHQQKRKMVRS